MIEPFNAVKKIAASFLLAGACLGQPAMICANEADSELEVQSSYEEDQKEQESSDEEPYYRILHTTTTFVLPGADDAAGIPEETQAETVTRTAVNATLDILRFLF